jgi:HAD superfamily hydrolase (TIGR01509 family)
MYPHFSDAPLDKLLGHFRDKAVETIVVSTSPLPDVEEVLSLLRAEGFRMAIATTKIRMHLDGILVKLGWESTFSATVGGDEVTKVKPAPEALELVLKRLQARADESLMIGDTINDVLAARAVPMEVVAVASPYGIESDLMAGSDHHIKSIADLPGLLNGFLR